MLLLLSYPQSGCAWLRALIAGYGGNSPADIPAIADRSLFESYLATDSVTLTAGELAWARPALNRLLAEDRAGQWFISHDANLTAPGADVPPFAPEMLGGVVLISRDPRDVASSLADQTDQTIDDAIAMMANKDRMMSGSRSLPCLLSSWSRFHQSWLEAKGVPLLLVRYEDLQQDAAGQLSAVLTFGGVTVEPDRVARAAAVALFENLARQGRDPGSPSKAYRRFLRQSPTGAWREILTTQQLNQICRDHGPMMTRLGYQP